ncbi:hypothetical protein L873DRAFT_1208921 [Choiromyces venosus 120613-1]|uniref:Uncharacterized protein n=1 Tax=Choiromyces venosus 120613-1 TaxID=1336337 RepID=A0A3N4JEK3_9PEZI|nr:hypothetical protein L873DRAFT_1208921 [Choiromyces venosus 120613-1]
MQAVRYSTNQPVVGKTAAWFCHGYTPHISPLPVSTHPPSPVHLIQPSPSPPVPLNLLCAIFPARISSPRSPIETALASPFHPIFSTACFFIKPHCSAIIRQCSYYRRRLPGIQAPPGRLFGVMECQALHSPLLRQTIQSRTLKGPNTNFRSVKVCSRRVRPTLCGLGQISCTRIGLSDSVFVFCAEQTSQSSNLPLLTI